MNWMLLPLKRYAEFSGRSRRKEYWMFILFLMIVYTVLAGTAMTMGFSAAMREPGTTGLVALIGSFGILAVFFAVFWLAMLIPSIAVSVRRLHDTNRSGWWLMLYVVPYILSTVLSVMAATSGSMALQGIGAILSLIGFVCAIVLLVFFCLDGTRGFNRFGADPKDPAGAESLQDVFR